MAANHSSVVWVVLLANIWLVASIAASNNSTQESSTTTLKSDKSQSSQIPSSAILNQLQWQQSNKLLSLLKNRSKNSTEPKSQQKRQASIESTSRRDDPWFLDQGTYAPQPYKFVYNVKGRSGQTEQYRREVGDGKFLTGSYGYMLPDGIYRHVDYVADDRGFRAFIRTSEPGTANQNPADVVINSNPVPAIPYENLHLNPFNYTYSPLLSDSYSNPSQPESNQLPALRPGSIVGGYLPLSYSNLQPLNDKLSTPSVKYFRGTDDVVPRVDYDIQDSRWNVKPNHLTGNRFRALEPTSLSDYWTIRQAQFAPRPPSNTYKLSYDRLPYDLDDPKTGLANKLAYDHQQLTNSAPGEGFQTSVRGASSGIALQYPINSVGYSRQNFQSEEHRQSNGSRFISKLGEPNQFSFREQGAGVKTGSSRELEYINTTDRDNNSNSEQILLPPPAPQFNQADELPEPAPKGARGALLQAPYSRYGPETNEAARLQQASVKGAIPQQRASGWPLTPQFGPLRTIRMPEELRSSLAMKDLRSMRHNIGLPQPPRAVAPISVSEQLDSHFNRLDESHKVHARRIDALLSGSILGAPTSASGGDSAHSPVYQQASVQSSSAVSAPTSNTNKDAHLVSTATGTGATLEEFKSAVGPEPEFSTQLAATNETFDARRLSARGQTAKPQLLTERVSELEKFQQRLRAQQLLLENVKQAAPNEQRPRSIANKLHQAASPSSSSKARSTGPVANSVSADNSQVSYDEEPERATAHKSVGANRWPEVGARSNQVGAPPDSSGRPQRALSEFAAMAKTWPSIMSNSDSRLQRNSANNSTTNVAPQPSHLEPANQPHRSPNQRLVLDGSPGNGSEQLVANYSQTGMASGGGGNTINLDFINSVTALSVDDMNPFAIASVNPGVSMANNNKLSAESRLFPHGLLSATSGGADSTRPATMSTRFFISPELRSAADYHEKQNTMGQLRSLFGVASDDNEIEPGSESSVSRPKNHRFSISPSGAPYMLGSASSRSISEDANGKLVQHSNGAHKKKPSQEDTRTGSIEMRSKHQFYEVASVGSPDRHPSESVSAFVAYKDAQLSIPAISSRRR